MSDIQKGGVGSGIKGHTTFRDSNTSALNIRALMGVFGKVFYDKMKKWQEEFPEEGVDREWMKSEVEQELTWRGDIPVKNTMGWLDKADKGGRIAEGAKKLPVKASSIPHACYYNAIDVVKKYHDKGYELAYGTMISKEKIIAWEDSAKKGKLVGLTTNPFMMHAFVVKDGDIYDPTLGKNNDDYYAYDIVSKSEWEKFSFKENDKEYDARDFVGWIEDKLLNHATKEVDIQKGGIGGEIKGGVNLEKGILGNNSFLDLINSLLGLLTHHKLEKEVISASHNGLRLGINTAKLDTGIDELEPDEESLARIGLRARALSDRTMSKARGDLAFKAEKLYQELNAAIKSGMTEVEALGRIRPRVRKLFTDALKPYELERLVRDQFLMATKEGRRSGWSQSGVKWRQWAVHSDNKTGKDSKRMKGQITKIDEPYTDPKTGDKYMIEHIRPNDRCYGVPLFELPKTTTKGGLMYAKLSEGDFQKGGVGSGVRGHTTAKQQEAAKSQDEAKKEIKNILMNDGFVNIGKDKWYEGI